ncbi:SDR family NAD(P)-dependent oxidoreductase [Streptomyces sp. GMY02]|uniref:SDR family NAD(P)-dependent oxidoreductase n=1 Tax=Streptomyces sp. GMY02 TaxID=1333528 RepID=UPI001C2CAB76|nr:SDR family NAD(P)-dependent oxidoreductase [Streptomyces sp. GMY02]QXE33991.1 SDR family NAD(P)-dependent oxidoreductase [Streptomyces sp. GMY02]
MTSTPRTLPNLSGRTYAVTGGNAGIGYFISEQLAAAGAHVVVLGRNPERLGAALDSIRARLGSARATSVPLDLADLDSVAEAAEALRGLDRLDGLIANAGISDPGQERSTTPQGFELAVGTNHLGHFALTALVMPRLAATPGSRVVAIGSIMTKTTKFDPDDLQSERSYRPQHAYTQSKHAVLLTAFELDRRLRAADVDVHSLAAHPGLSVDPFSPARDGIVQSSAFGRALGRLPLPVQGKDRAARSALRAATDPGARGGQYYGPRRGSSGRPALARPPRISLDAAVASRLWSQSEELTGITFDPGADRG